jgi:ribosome-binding protein aMBF1 (putative translation factor)
MTRGVLAMSQRSDWQELRSRRMTEPGAAEAYDAARLAFELGRQVRELRVQQGLSQTELARRAGMTQPAVARFEAGGTVPTLPVLERLARSLGTELTVKLTPSSSVA